MDRLQSAALLTSLVEKLRAQGSWAGETHVQKASYLLQELVHVPLGFRFVLYKYGPFSFELRNELTSLREDDLLSLEIRDPKYGPSYVALEQAKYIQSLYPKTMKTYVKHVDFIAEKLGDKRVSDLEKIATSYYVTKKFPEDPIERRAEELRKLKPHIADDDAISAMKEMDSIAKEAAEIFT